MASLVQRRSHAFRDDGRLLIRGESDHALISLRANEQHTYFTTARIGGDPSFVRCGDVLDASFHGSLMVPVNTTALLGSNSQSDLPL